MDHGVGDRLAGGGVPQPRLPVAFWNTTSGYNGLTPGEDNLAVGAEGRAEHLPTVDHGGADGPAGDIPKTGRRALACEDRLAVRADGPYPRALKLEASSKRQDLAPPAIEDHQDGPTQIGLVRRGQLQTAGQPEQPLLDLVLLAQG